MKSSLQTHFSFDVPDEHAGAVNRYIAGLRGVTNIIMQANGTTRKKGDSPSKMNEGTKASVVFNLFQKHGEVNRPMIIEALGKAGFSNKAVNSTIAPFLKDKTIKRVGYGKYILVTHTPALAAPKKAK